jgi:S-adenosylmethionine hydrolase
VRLPEPRLGKQGEWVVGEVVEEDRFGNLATNLPEDLARLAGGVEAGGSGSALPRDLRGGG